MKELEKVCEKNCPDCSGMAELHAKECKCSCHKVDFIFECKKCGHSLYVGKNKIESLFMFDCPNCGEESGEIWILTGEGNFKKRNK